MEVSLITMYPKRTIESFFTASLIKRSYQHIENDTAADEEVVAPSPCVDQDDKPVTSTDKNGISPILFS